MNSLKNKNDDLHFAGNLYPEVILASPVGQPSNVLHSIFKLGPAAEWIAPSTKEENILAKNDQLKKSSKKTLKYLVSISHCNQKFLK